MQKQKQSFVKTYVADMKEEPTKEYLEDFVRQEINRYGRKHSEHKVQSCRVIIIDFWENFTAVTIKKGKDFATGYAKRNPGCDVNKVETGLSIATWRALTRLRKRD